MYQNGYSEQKEGQETLQKMKETCISSNIHLSRHSVSRQN